MRRKIKTDPKIKQMIQLEGKIVNLMVFHVFKKLEERT